MTPSSTPLDRGELGFGWLCPYCLLPQPERSTMSLVFFYEHPVCGTCAAILTARRDKARVERRDERSGTGLAGKPMSGVSPVSAPITGEEINRRVQAEQDARAENRRLEGAGGLKHAEG